MLDSFFNFLTKRPARSLTLLLVVLGVIFSQIQYFSLDASEDSLSLDGDENLALYNKTIETFGLLDILVISYTASDGVLKPDQLKHLRVFRDQLLSIEKINTITSILDVSLFKSPPLNLIELVSDIYTIDNGKADMSLVENEFKSSPLYANNLVSEDGNTTALLITLKTANELEIADSDILKSTVNEIRQTMDKHRDNAQLFLGGVPMIRNDIVSFIAKDIVVFSLSVIALMSAVLIFIFRSIRWVLIPILVSTCSALVMTGIIGSLGWKVTVISANFFSLLLVLTLSINIHLVVRYRELAQTYPDLALNELVIKTLQQMLKPCIFTTLTTVAAFASFTMSSVRPVIDFGWMMSIGVCISLTASFIAFPVLMSLMSKPKVKTHNTELPIVQKMAYLTDKYGNQLVAVSLLLVVICLFGVSKLGVENRFIDYFKKSTEINQGLTFIDQKLGGTIPLEIVFDDLANDYWADETLRKDFHKVHQYVESLDATGKVLSIDTLMEILSQANDNKMPNGFLLSIGRNKMPQSAKSQVLDPHISDKTDQLRLVARIKETNQNLNRNELINDIRMQLINEFGFKPDSFKFTGPFTLYNNLLESLFDSQIRSIAVVFFIVFLMFLFIFRSISISVLAIIPNMLPSLFILGIMGLANIPLDIMTITIAAIAIGIGVDNAIHYIHRFKAELIKDNDYRAAMYRSHDSIGLAILFTAVTVAIGFSVLILSNFIPSIYFGVFTAIAMLSAFIVNLTLLPKLILIFKPKMNNTNLTF